MDKSKWKHFLTRTELTQVQVENIDKEYGKWKTTRNGISHPQCLDPYSNTDECDRGRCSTNGGCSNRAVIASYIKDSLNLTTPKKKVIEHCLVACEHFAAEAGSSIL